MPTQFASTGEREWTNFHQNLRKSIVDRLTVNSRVAATAIEQYNSTTGMLQGLIEKCLQGKTLLRAIGAGWSWTGVTVPVNGLILDTSSKDNVGMDLVIDLSESAVDNTFFQGDPKSLVLCECGIQIRKLNSYLEKTNRSLKSSGASDGQTIVGAMSTGTHGSNPIVGAIVDYVVQSSTMWWVFI
jgi:FAD/FMN-containing dehydrogenase